MKSKDKVYETGFLCAPASQQVGGNNGFEVLSDAF
jgi:hypothetical protein